MRVVSLSLSLIFFTVFALNSFAEYSEELVTDNKVAKKIYEALLVTPETDSGDSSVKVKTLLVDNYMLAIICSEQGGKHECLLNRNSTLQLDASSMQIITGTDAAEFFALLPVAELQSHLSRGIVSKHFIDTARNLVLTCSKDKDVDAAKFSCFLLTSKESDLDIKTVQVFDEVTSSKIHNEVLGDEESAIKGAIFSSEKNAKKNMYVSCILHHGKSSCLFMRGQSVEFGLQTGEVWLSAEDSNKIYSNWKTEDVTSIYWGSTETEYETSKKLTDAQGTPLLECNRTVRGPSKSFCKFFDVR